MTPELELAAKTWQQAKSDPVVAASDMGRMDYADGVHTSCLLITRLIREIEALKAELNSRAK